MRVFTGGGKITEAELALIDQGIAEVDRGEGMTF